MNNYFFSYRVHTHTHTHTGEGPTLSPNPTPPSPVRPPAGAPLQSRADARVGDESQDTPTRIPPLKLGSSGNDRTPKWNDAALACAGHSPPGRKGPVLWLVREAGAPYPKKVRGGRQARRPSGTAL